MALNIPVGEDYRIKSDNFNVIVEQRYFADPTKAPNWKQREAEGASPEPKEKWREVAFRATVEQALQDIVSKSVLNSNAESIEELLVEITELRRVISDVVDV